MIALDTNVLVRYIMQDDVQQAALATRLIESLHENAPAFISLVSVVELCWVLESAYGLTRSQIVEVFQKVLAITAFKVDRALLVTGAVKAYRDSKADFADCLIERSAVQAGCQSVMTFDRAAAKTAGMTLIC